MSQITSPDPSAAKPKHTPGPWKAMDRHVLERPVRITGRHFVIVPEGGPFFAYLPEGARDIQQANARLIAAAPDLLAACKGALPTLEDDLACVSGDEYPGLQDAVTFMRAAIAKAVGNA